MAYIILIILFIICSAASGYLFNAVYLRSGNKRDLTKLNEIVAQMINIGDNLENGMFYRVMIDRKKGSRTFDYVSAGVKNIHGLTPEEVIADGSLIFSQIHPEDWEKLVESEKNAIENMAPFNLEMRITNTAKETRWLNIIAHPVLMQDGNMAVDVFEMDITDRKTMEENLRRSEENYRNIINNMQDVFYRTDLDGKIIMASPSIKRLLWHESTDEYKGMTIPENFYNNPSDRQVMLDILKKEGAVSDFETILRRKNGDLFPVSISSRFYYDSDGNAAGVEGIVRDITERKKAEELFRAAFHENPCPMTITETDTGRFLEINKAWFDVMEYGWDDIRGKTSAELNVFQNPGDPVRFMGLLLENGKISGLELGLVSKSGKKISGLFYADLVETDGKKIALATMLDITEQNRFKEESLRNALSFKTIFEESPHSITINRVNDGTYVMVNRAFEKNTGYTAEEVIGRQSNDFTIRESRDEAVSFSRQLAATGRIDNAMTKTLTKQGEERYSLFSSRIIDFNGEQCFLSFSIDMTETRRIQSQLLQAQKMDAIGRLAGGVAHDFNNMLAGIIGATELLQIHSDDAAKRGRYINLIKSTAERASELTAKMLAFSRKNEIELIPVDVHRIIEDTFELLSRSIDRKIDIKLEFKAEDSIIKGDMSQLMNVFLNLGINAGHAMEGGGKLTFSTRTAELDETWCRINSPDLTPGRYIIVEVRDTGHGIPQESIGRIFDPFFTTSKKGKGTGLGLSAVYGNIKQHNGTINVYSEPGRGSVFNLYLPLTGESVASSIQSKDIIMGSGVILVIDDEEMLRTTAREILQHLGYEVLEAANGREGVDIYAKEYKRIDAVLLDMVMPVMNGHECFIELKSINPDVKVIITSGFMQDNNFKDIKEAGPTDFIRKPYQTAELSRVLANVLSGRNLPV